MIAKQPKLLTSLQCRAARGALQWSATDLSDYSGVGTTTISRFEKGHGVPIRANLTMLRRTFEEAGVEFIEDSGLIVRKPAFDEEEEG